MKVGECVHIRMADPDDAEALVRFYDPTIARSMLLDVRRELQYPTADELRETLRSKEVRAGLLYIIEDDAGALRGCCALKPPAPEVTYSEMLFGLAQDEDYAGPIGDEAMAWLLASAFVKRRLSKVMAQCLETETGYRGLLTRHGFTSDGVQREVVYTGGRYLALETLSVVRDAYLARRPPVDATTASNAKVVSPP